MSATILTVLAGLANLVGIISSSAFFALSSYVKDDYLLVFSLVFSGFNILFQHKKYISGIKDTPIEDFEIDWGNLAKSSESKEKED